MVQFYLLSVVFNLLAAFILIYGKKFADTTVIGSENNIDDFVEKENDVDLSDEVKKSEVYVPGLDNGMFRLVVGILTVFVGLIKFISAYKGIPVLGDLLPSAAGILSGASLLVEYYYVSASEPELIPDSVKTFFLDSRKYIGIGCFVVAVLHFIMPGIIIF